MKAIALALLVALPAFALPKDKQLHVAAGAIVAANHWPMFIPTEGKHGE